VIEVSDEPSQASAVVSELRRLRELGVTDWSGIAVLSREHADLARVRALAERESIPVRWAAARTAVPPLHQIREIHRFLSALGRERGRFDRASRLRQMASEMFKGSEPNPWIRLLERFLEAWEKESCNAELPVLEALEFLYGACAESRREFSHGDGVMLTTVHSAKGMEYDHVLLIGPWRLPTSRETREEERRAFYVGMTRARKTLAVLDRIDVRPSLPQQMGGRGTARHAFTARSKDVPQAAVAYDVLSLEDIHLGYPGQFEQGHPIHGALAALRPQDRLTMRAAPGGGIGLYDQTHTAVARLSRSAQAEWEARCSRVCEVRVLALVERSSEQDPDPARRERYRVKQWEVPLVEVVSSA
jgi:ATP-dependent DNA helicase RecQ